MPGQSSAGLGLPKFHRDEKQQNWVASERRTANLIQSFWNAAGLKRRNDPTFLCLLVQCGWGNHGSPESTRKWRNRKIAEHFKLKYLSDEQLAHHLSSCLKALTVSQSLSLLKSQTGITDYFPPFRPATLKFVKRRSGCVAFAFRQVSAGSADVYDKVRRVATLIESLGEVSAAGRHVSPFNGLTPVLSCLDPQRRFPIMNKRTRALLKYIERREDKEGAVALSELIGPNYDIRDNRELDVYANTEKFPKLKTHTRRTDSADAFKDVGLKSEINSIAQIAAKKTSIKKLHNKLINRLNHYLLWRQITAEESKFDALVIGWKHGRDLLIEGKTASEGPAGTSQVRQAIGQLFDYRFTHMPKNRVDLALLLGKEPSDHVQRLLASLGIELLWFKGKSLMGTIRL